MINGIDFARFEFDAILAGENARGEATFSKTYNYVQHAFKKNKRYIFNFSCPLDQKSLWKKASKRMMDNVSL